MSKAGCPYDNAPMERYYNTLKNDCINLHYYHSDKELNTAIEEFAYVWYNHVRPLFFARKKCTKLQRKIHNIARKSTQKMCIFLLTHC